MSDEELAIDYMNFCEREAYKFSKLSQELRKQADEADDYARSCEKALQKLRTKWGKS